MSAVAFQHVTKIFPGGHVAVRDLTLHVADGELIVIVGPSGCGKSTTLRLLAGLETPTTGEIRIDDRRVNELPSARRDVAMVFQNYALYPHLSVRQNLAFGLRLRRTPRAEVDARTAEAAATLGLTSLLDRRPSVLAGGERQRVALGRAIVRRPRAFLFDEPLSNLDAQLRVQMRAEIAALHRRLGATMLYVTHDQVEALTLGQRIVVMNAGVVQQIDEPLAVYRRPVNRFVASFIGSPPMNFVPGTLDGATFRHAGGEHRFSGAASPANRAALLGIRPEHLCLNGEGPALGQFPLESIERLGADAFGHFQLAGQRWTLRLPADANLNPRDIVAPRIAAEHVHFFADDAAGQRLE